MEEPELVVRQCVLILFVALRRSCTLISNEEDSVILNIYPIQKLPFAAKKTCRFHLNAALYKRENRTLTNAANAV